MYMYTNNIRYFCLLIWYLKHKRMKKVGYIIPIVPFDKWDVRQTLKIFKDICFSNLKHSRIISQKLFWRKMYVTLKNLKEETAINKY